MKIVVIGDVLGRVDLINEYVDKAQADIALCTGDIGLFKKNTDIHANSPYYFDVRHEFFAYAAGRKEFIKPVITVHGPHDNFSGVKDLQAGQYNIKNFTLLKNGEPITIKNTTKDTINLPEIVIGGIGGVYSPKSYNSDKEYFRHFRKSEIDSLKKHQIHILLMHDLIGGCSKKQIIFSDDTYSLLEATKPFYCIVGKYRWFGHVKLPNTRIVVMPKAQDGYLLIDTNEWDAEAFFNLNMFGKS